jgi:hypothetical protein
MSRRVMVLLTATATAVAMLAVAGIGWAQEEETTAPQEGSDAGSTAVAPADRDDPKIRPLRPNPGSKTTDRTPTIEAKVTDNDHDLEKGDIKLYLDRDRVRNFDYSRRREELEFTPNNRLSFGKHTVKVVAEAAQGEKATESWSFRVAGPSGAIEQEIREATTKEPWTT